MAGSRLSPRAEPEPGAFSVVSATSGRLGIDGREALFVLSVFSLSRLLVFGAMVLSPLVVPPVQRSGAWNLDDPILRPRFDAGWYLTIAKDGYSYDGDPGRQQNIVFFPLYPLTCRLCHVITGVSVPLCGALLSNGAFLVALATLYVLVAGEVGSGTARLTLVLLAFFPGSLFFSTMYTESFYLLFSAQAFLAFQKERFILGGCWAGLASATRLPGILLLIPLLSRALPRLKDRPVRGRLALAAMLASSGLAGFMIYQAIAFGDPLAYLRVQQAWGRSVGPLFGGVIDDLASNSHPFQFKPLNDIGAAFTLVFIALTYVLFRHLPWSYGAYTLLIVVMQLATGGTHSMTRYLSVLFPGFVALAVIAHKWKWIPWLVIPAFALKLGVFSIRFAQWY